MDDYILAKETVQKKYPVTHPFYSLFVFSLYAFFHKYSRMKSKIQELFYDTDIYIENGSVFEIMKNHSLDSEDFYNGENDSEDGSITYALSSMGYSFSMSTDSVQFEKASPFIVCSLNEISPTVLLNLFIHEMNHLIKGIQNGYQTYQNDTKIGYYLRSGLNYYHYYYEKENDYLYEVDYFNTLDEVINTIQSTEMVLEIKALLEYLEDAETSNFARTLDSSQMNEYYGYETCVDVFRSLWSDDSFRLLVENNIIQGDIQTIIDEFNRIMGDDCFMDLADTLDEIDDLESVGSNSKKISLLTNHLQSIIENYLQKKKNKVNELSFSFSKS